MSAPHGPGAIVIALIAEMIVETAMVSANWLEELAADAGDERRSG